MYWVFTILFILAGVALIAFSVLLFAKKADAKTKYGEEDAKDYYHPGRWLAGGIAALLLLIPMNSFTMVPTGYTGVKSVFGQINPTPAASGPNFKIPFVTKVTLVNNKQQKVTIKDRIWGDSSEKVQVYGEDTDVFYYIAPEKSAWLLANVANMKDLISSVDLASAMKDAMATLDAEHVTVRELIEPATRDKLNFELATRYGEGTVIVRSIKIFQMDFEDSYNEAIAERNAATKKQEQAAIENETKIAAANAEKEVKRIEANADAEALHIRATAEANANKIINGSVTDNVLKNKFYENWDGKLPNVMGDSTVITDITP